MLGAWGQQQSGRNLASATIEDRQRHVRRFREFAGDYPWAWKASDLDEYSGFLRTKRLAASTIRQVHNSLSLFCEYLINPGYDWVELCEKRFGNTPSQICFPWNTTRHLVDYEGSPGRRALTYDELEQFFAHADSKVETAIKQGRKGALGRV